MTAGVVCIGGPRDRQVYPYKGPTFLVAVHEDTAIDVPFDEPVPLQKERYVLRHVNSITADGRTVARASMYVHESMDLDAAIRELLRAYANG